GNAAAPAPDPDEARPGHPESGQPRSPGLHRSEFLSEKGRVGSGAPPGCRAPPGRTSRPPLMTLSPYYDAPRRPAEGVVHRSHLLIAGTATAAPRGRLPIPLPCPVRWRLLS